MTDEIARILVRIDTLRDQLRSAQRDLYAARKVAQVCPRCGAPSSTTSIMCERHRRYAAEKTKAAYWRRKTTGG